MMSGVARGSVVDVEQRSEVSGSSFEVLSRTKVTAVQLLRIHYNRRMTFAHVCSEFATIAHNWLIISALDLRVGDITFCTPQRASVGTYSGCEYPYKSVYF